RLDGRGMEYCRLSEGNTGPAIEGIVVLTADVPWGIEYEIRCDQDWRTRTVRLRARAGVEDRELRLDVDPQGRWKLNAQRRADLEGCLDVDLGFSPSTNTLPIRRLRLNLNAHETITAAWVEFPSLAVHRVEQRYTRIRKDRYKYENLPTGFVAEVTVDATGLVVSYPPGWERLRLDLMRD
ncbi:MAG: putative glycolipid-binding domain-containing protein, partial [Acidobacteriota bacterium]